MEQAPAPEFTLTKRQGVWFEATLLLFAIYLPQLFFSVEDYLWDRIRFITPAEHLYNIVEHSGRCLLVLFVFWKSGRRLSDFGISKPQASDFLWGVVILNLMVFLTWGGRFLLHKWSGVEGFYGPTAIGAVDLSAGSLGFMFTSVVLEELLYRGWACSRFMALWKSPALAVGLSALLFAAPHVYQGWSAPIVVFPIGLVLGICYLRTRSLWPVFIGHFSFDLLVHYSAATHRHFF
jgi:membrane protease YdiL (CAAX protease family)